MLLRVAALLATFASLAHADPAWEARVGAGLGPARASMFGASHGAVGLTLDVDVLRWFSPSTGAGLYVGELIAEPWHTVTDDRGRSTFRDLAFEIEPELAHRQLHPIASHVGVGWEVTGGAGLVTARTYESCHSTTSRHGCALLLEHSTELGVTTGVGALAYAGPVLVDIGVRAQTDTAGDAAIALQASAGAVF